MNLLADESIGKSIVDELRRNGHNVLYITEFAPSIDDESVLHQANLNRALLLTEDKDFGELVFRQGLVHMGVVLIRLSGLSLPAKVTSVSTVLATTRTNYWKLSVLFHLEGLEFAEAHN